MRVVLKLRTEWKNPLAYRFDVEVDGVTRFAWHFDQHLSYQSKEHHVFTAVIPDGRRFVDDRSGDALVELLVTPEELDEMQEKGADVTLIEAIYEDLIDMSSTVLRLLGGAV